VAHALPRAMHSPGHVPPLWHPAHAIVAQLRMRAGIVMRRALLIREGADIRLVEQFDTRSRVLGVVTCMVAQSMSPWPQ
jgi:hypothetical protein